MSSTVFSTMLAAFLATGVEFVEALTIVLAVGVTAGWASAMNGAVVAVVALAVIVAVGAPLLASVPLAVLQGIIGLLLLLFGIRWLRKAILRFAGHIALHDEAAAYQKNVAKLKATGAGEGFVTAFNGVFLEGLEIVFIVLGFGSAGQSLGPAVIGAAVAGVAIVATGFVVRTPLSRVPENWMKFVVGIMLTSFGAFWAGEGIGAAWPGGDLSLPVVIALFLLASWVAVVRLKKPAAAARA